MTRIPPPVRMTVTTALVHEQTTMSAAPPQETDRHGRRTVASKPRAPARRARRRRPVRRRRISCARSSPRTTAPASTAARRHALSAGAQRLPALRPRQVDHPEFRARRRERRPLPPALRRHQSAEGGRRVRGLDRRRRCAGSASTGATHRYHASDYYDDLYRVRRVVHRAGARLRRQPVGRGDARAARHADRGRAGEPVPRPHRRRESRSLPPDARGRVSGRRARAAAQDRHGEPERQHARSGDLPDPPRDRTTAPATSGASIRSTTTRTASPTRSSGSRIRSARSSSRTTGRSTTG